MGNQQAAYILGQIERIEKRMTAMQEHGLDIGALSSQVSTAREMLGDERYGDASIFCQELMDLADQIVQNGNNNGGAGDESSASSKPIVIVDDDTKRFNKPVNLQKQLEDVLREDVIGSLNVPTQVSSVISTARQQHIKQDVLHKVAQDLLNTVLQTVPNVENKRLERALSDVLEKQSDNESIEIDRDDPIQWALQEAINKSVEQSLYEFEHEMNGLMEDIRKGNHKVSDQELQTDNVVSVQLVHGTEQNQEGDVMSTDEVQQDSSDESFSDLPRIPRHGEPLEDDSTFSSVAIDPSLSSEVYNEETTTNPQLAGQEAGPESYEPETGSNLRPNTSVFTEANSIKAKTAQILPESNLREPAMPAESGMGGSVAMNREQLKEQLISLLPELLQDEEVKQALFACLAIEMVTRPSVLGSLAGLREFLHQELLAVNQGAFQES